MPAIETTYRPELTQDRPVPEERFDPATGPFFSILFRAFDQHGVRYCGLHADGGLLYRTDFAVHPADRRKLGGVVLALREQGYLAVQWLELESGRHRISFARVVGTASETVTIDLVLRNSIATPVNQLLRGRRRESAFWRAMPEDEFDYLLSDASLRGAMSPLEAEQLKFLVGHLGPQAAQERADRLFGRSWGKPVVAACVSGFDAELLANLRRNLRRRALARKPLLCVRSEIARWGIKLRARLARRGAFLVFLGPDGVGKTTMLRGVSSELAPLFPVQTIYRWRPAVFARAPRPARLPHSKPLRGTRGSILYLLFAWLDFMAGYVLTTRWVLAQGGLVIFDRYYHDLLVDPVRYRYAGPMWLIRALSRLVPPRRIFFLILDADEHTILSRKQQLPVDEIRRQRALYRKFASEMPASVVVKTDRSVEGCRVEALQESFRYLSEQLARRNPVWFGVGQTVLHPHSLIPLSAAGDHARPEVPVRNATESLNCEGVLNPHR